MKRGIAAQLLTAGLLALAVPAMADPDTAVWTDPKGDATPRHTNTGANGPINPAATLPDMVRLTLSGWQAFNAATDPYSGFVVDPEHAHLFRMQVTFAGLVNPPGPLSGSSGFDPFRFGISPVYGFLELDMDADKETGGELGAAAKSRYLANVGRFGRMPSSALGPRAATWGTQLDGIFSTAPQYERSGADMVLNLCGCYQVTIVSQNGNSNGVFEAGETWVVRSAFFQRVGGYKDACFSFGGASGIPGLYDPWVNLRFSHSTSTNQTTITLVYALDMVGAGQLAGQAPQSVNYNAGDQTSVLEAISDVIDGAPFLPSNTPVWFLANRWIGRNPSDSLNPTRWRPLALFGTSYQTPQDSSFAWTDTGFDEVAGDVNGDALADLTDAAAVRQTIDTLDGGPLDGEGSSVENQSVTIIDPGPNFCIFDVDGDGRIDLRDVRIYCIGDYNRDGLLNINDFIAFSTGFAIGDPRADTDRNGVFDVNDFVGFGNAYAAGCP